MAPEITEELKGIINNSDSVKILASVDLAGRPHAVVKGSIRVTEDGKIQYLEFFENSKTSKNLLLSLWYAKPVAITVISPGRKSFQIKGRAVRSIIAGSEFEKHYVAAQERDSENDLSSIYIIEVDEVIDQTYHVRRQEEHDKNPLYVHLDRLTG